MDAILFDVTGVLIGVRGGVGSAYAEVGARHGLALDAARVQRAFAAALEAAPPLAFPGLDATARAVAERAWWKAVVRRAVPEAAGPRFASFFEDLYGRFGEPDAWVVSEGAPRVLATLRERGFTLGVLSNFDGRLPRLLAELGLAEHFQTVATSASLGAAKPDPRAFEGALALLGKKAACTAHVGDSPEADGRGAARAGLLPVLVGAPLPAGVPGLSISRLADLPALFLTPARRAVMRRPTAVWLAPLLAALSSAACAGGEGGTPRAAAPDSVAALLEAEMARFPERFAEEPFPLIEIAQVDSLVASGADVLIVDAREPEAYARGHLPGAVNYPFGNWLEAGKPLPPADRDLVVYCNNRDCPIARLWSEQAAQRGYTRVRHMKAGFGGWLEAGLPAETGFPSDSAGAPPEGAPAS